MGRSFAVIDQPYYRTPYLAELKIEKSHQDFSLLAITLLVVTVHLFAIWFSTLSPSKSLSKYEAKSKVVVKTVHLNPRLQPLNLTKEPPVISVEPAKTALDKPLPQPILEQKEPEQQPKPPKTAELPLNDSPPPTPAHAPAPTPQIEASKTTAEPTKSKEETTSPPVNKVETKKVEGDKPSKPKTTPSKGTSKEVKKNEASQQQAPVKKTKTEPAKPAKPTKKEATPTPEEIAAKEAEKKRMQELEAVKEAARVKQQELLAKAKQNIAKMGESRDKIASNKSVSLETTSIPKQLESLQIDAIPAGTNTPAELNAKEIDYRDGIAYRLKLALKLPEYGAVQIKLTLERSGQMIQVQFTHSESSKNKQYLEKMLPTLVFPPFENNFADLAQYTFLITLNN